MTLFPQLHVESSSLVEEHPWLVSPQQQGAAGVLFVYLWLEFSFFATHHAVVYCDVKERLLLRKALVDPARRLNRSARPTGRVTPGSPGLRGWTLTCSSGV